MKKTLIILILFFNSIISVSAEAKRIISGNENAKITIIAYESLTCSHCANFHIDVYPQLKKDYIDTGLAKIEFRHFPLDIAAFKASKIAQCKNDKGLEILESLYSNQQAWVKGSTAEEIDGNLKKFLEKEGFKLNFEKCINDKVLEDHILEDRINGMKSFKVQATPTLIIMGEKFEKPLTYKNIKKYLEKLI